MRFFLALCLIATIVILNVVEASKSGAKVTPASPTKPASEKASPAKATEDSKTAENPKKGAKGVKGVTPKSPTAGSPAVTKAIPLRPQQPEMKVIGFNFHQLRDNPVLTYTRPQNKKKYSFVLGTEGEEFNPVNSAYILKKILEDGKEVIPAHGGIVQMIDVKDTAGVAKIMENKDVPLTSVTNTAVFEYTDAKTKNKETVNCAARIITTYFEGENLSLAKAKTN